MMSELLWAHYRLILHTLVTCVLVFDDNERPFDKT